MAGRAVGIDLGTSNSVVSAVIDGEAIVIGDSDGRTIHPSVVSWLPDKRTVVGEGAKARMSIDPDSTIYSVKRLVGRPFYSQEVRMASDSYAYSIVKGGDDNPRVQVQGTDYTVEEIQALILRHLKRVAEDYLGEAVTQAVITVPANFNEAQRRATKMAGQLAGLEVLRILNEPTAAALAYGYEQQLRERIAVYDLGGGTFDITILELRDNVLEVLSTAGDTFLGGDDFDAKVSVMLAEDFERQTGYALKEDKKAMQRLKPLAEKLKVELTDSETATTIVKHVIPGQEAPTSIEVTLNRAAFNRNGTQLIQKSFLVCDEALKLAEITSAEVDRLVLVGGATRMPMVREMVEQYFFKKPLHDINPDEVVAVGAAIYAYGLQQQAPALPPQPPQLPQRVPKASSPQATMMGMSPPPHAPAPSDAPPGPTERGLPSVSSTKAFSPVDAEGAPQNFARIQTVKAPAPPSRTRGLGAVVPPPPPAAALGVGISSNAPPPTPDSHRRRADAYSGGDENILEMELDPEASTVPGLMDNTEADGTWSPEDAQRTFAEAPLLIDVTPQALGIQTIGGYMDSIIPRNSRLPVRTTRTYGTNRDFQELVRVNILEGESRMASESRPLGELLLVDLPPLPRGTVQIDVSFEINTDGMLSVTARDRNSGKTAQTKLNIAGGMSDELMAELQSRDLPEAYEG
jgi:molecular chaperone DnaK